MKSKLSFSLLTLCAVTFGMAFWTQVATVSAMDSSPKAAEPREVALIGSGRADDNRGLMESSGGWGPGRSRDTPESGIVSPLDFGARCDGTGDDAIAINKAIDYIRTHGRQNASSPLTGVLLFPARQCTLKTTINATRLVSASVMIVGTGGSLLCETAGQPCIDAMDSALLGFRDISIFGDEKDLPRIGLQVGRPASRASAAGMYLDHVTIDGFFSLAAFYNLNAETQLVLKLNVSNRAPNGYGAIYDGINHWDAKSAFVPVTEQKDAPESFNDNTCVDCRITSNGVGGIPLWAGGTAELTFANSYISNFGGGVGAVLYSWNNNLNFDAHFETEKLTSVFLLAGSRHPNVYGLTLREHDFFGQVSLFALDKEARVATLSDVDINIGSIHNHVHGQWFDDPTKYTVSGRVAGVRSDGWVEPGGGFSGTACFGTKCVTQ